MRWLFGKKPTQEERYQQAITAISRSLFETSVVLTEQLKEGWASIPSAPVLDKEQEWTIAVEVLWYLLALCDRSLRFTFWVLDVDHVMDDVTERALNEFVSRVVGLTSTAEGRQHLRKEQLERLYAWKAKADLDYSAPVQPFSLPPDLLHARVPEGSPLARLTRRVEDAIGLPPRQALEDGESDFDRIIREGPDLDDIFELIICQVDSSLMTQCLREMRIAEVFKTDD